MKKLVLIFAFCLAWFGGLEAQNYWSSIRMQGIFMGVAPDGSYYSFYTTEYGNSITRTQDEGYNWQVVLGYETGFDCYLNNRCFSVTPERRMFFFEDYPYRAFYSDDYGYYWQVTEPVPIIYPASAEHLFALNNNTIVGTTDNYYAFWTTDGGASWDTTRLDFMYSINNSPSISDLLVNENGDVYYGLRNYDGTGGGIYHSTISDMQNWQLVTGSDYSILDMAFDPEGNVVACAWKADGNVGFQHISGCYLFDGCHLAVSNNGIIYSTSVTADNTAVLTYSLDHGETFVEIGEGLPLDPPLPDYQDGSLYLGYNNYLYFEGRGDYWKTKYNADDIPEVNPWLDVEFFDEASSLYYLIISDDEVEVTFDDCYINSGINSYYGDIVIPETVTYDGVTYTVTGVGQRAFHNCNGPLTSVVVPNTVTSIGELAFAGNGQLSSVILPNSVNTIGDRIFYDCQSLASVQLPVGISVLTLEMFYNCVSLTSFVIPPTVTRIEERAFYGAGLHSVEIPESVTYIGEEAFLSCLSLSSVDLPNTTIEMGSGVFSFCIALQSIHLPENLETIPSLFLNGCENLTSITIPETVTNIEDCAFLNCYGLTEIELPASVTILGESAFQNCRALDSINIPETVETIGNNVFLGCENLRTVTLPQGMDAIPSGMFWGCTHLDTITIPESVVTINSWAFSDCVELREIVIPKNVTSLGYGVFLGCDKLRKVELGESVSLLANDVFKKNNNASVKLTLVCHGITPAQCGLTTFPNEALQEMVVVPCGCEGIYREAWDTYWQSGNFEEDCGSGGAEWYYEILNDDGSITYQYLHQINDTTIDDKEKIHVIVRINTLYDKGEHVQTSHEYVYDDNEKVYWWNKTLGEFTVLYDFDVELGDEWEIKVDSACLVMHVDAVEQYEYEGRLFKMLQVSDAENLFSGTIVRGIGHLTSFFPERLLNTQKGYRVEGIRCFWKDDLLLFKYGDKDCDEVYEEFHDYEIDEPIMAEGIRVYPNPTDGIIVVETQCIASLQQEQAEYRITNLMGQTLMTGQIKGESQTIDVSALPDGLYFITFADKTHKIVIK